MSSDVPEQSVPIIIKGGRIHDHYPIGIDSLSYFRVIQSFQSQTDDWLESSSVFELSRVESINLVSPIGDVQFCQTSTMSHPLTFAFKDAQDKNIFIIKEVAASGAGINENYILSINVQYSNSYFQIAHESSESLTTEEFWNNSIFTSTTETEVAKIEVTDSGGTPVCQFLRSSDEEITLSLEPPV